MPCEAKTRDVKCLTSLEPGQSGIIRSVKGDSAIRRRVLEMGLVPGTMVRVERQAPMGGPISLWFRGYELSLRIVEAELIWVTPTDVGGCGCSSGCGGGCK